VKICLVSQEYPPETGGGGIGTQTYLKAHGLSARGHQVHVVSASWDREPRTSRDGPVLLHRIGEPDLAGLGSEPTTYWLAYSAAVAAKVHELHRAVRFDVIHFPEYGGEGFVYQTDTFVHRTARYVVQLHGPLAMFVERLGWPERGSALAEVGCFMERAVLHRADLVLSSSHATAAFCAARYGYPLDRIHVIHSGIDTARFAPRPRPEDPDRGSPRILFVGNLVGSKGFDDLVEAVIRLRARHPRIRLRAIGKGEPAHLEEIAARVSAAGAEESVEVRGYVPYADLPSQYAWCDLFAGPSSWEAGPGNVYLEAMASGRPVIACDSGGTPEVVLDGRTGLLVPPGDAAALERAISSLADDRERREALGAAGRRWIADRFSIERYTDRVERLYAGLSPPEVGR
jgi:glycosyltransferase involved in cell wall biosynthesis